MNNKKLKIFLAAPRGFCAGVDRAIEIVKKSIKKFGAPVYVRHEIVHNKYVVDSLKNIGAIFVEELDEIEDKTRPVIFSAHGVPKSIPKEAKRTLQNHRLGRRDRRLQLQSALFLVQKIQFTQKTDPGLPERGIRAILSLL